MEANFVSPSLANVSNSAINNPSPLLVEMQHIWKRFPGVIANRGVNLELRSGEVHALLGENGAGKSTLMHILSGSYRPDAGLIRINGVEVQFHSPAQAIAVGIGMVHQHFRLVDVLSAAENIHLGWNKTPWHISPKILADRTQAYCNDFGLHIDPNAKIWQLSTGEQQRVEILRVLARGATVLILDEPTSVLTPGEAEELFHVTRSLAAKGRSVIFITHKLEEVLAVSDRVTILRNGRVVESRMTSECNKRSLATMLIGQEFVSRLHRTERKPGKQVLEVQNLHALNDRGLLALKGINLSIREGEILGIAGVAGNGQSELAEAINGLRHIQKGLIKVDGVDLTNLSPNRYVNSGVGHIPEDRQGMGLVTSLSVTDNAILRQYKRNPIANGMRLDSGEATKYTQKIVEQSAVKVSSIREPVHHLSGGNQQRLLTGRETQAAARLLIAVHPTQGLDISATEEVRRVLMNHRNEGSALLLISEDLEEILIMSDRIVVMYEGKIAGEFDASEVNRGDIGLLMGGAKISEEAL
jgi:simple sugar transport system ATP-binding protein